MTAPRSAYKVHLPAPADPVGEYQCLLDGFKALQADGGVRLVDNNGDADVVVCDFRVIEELIDRSLDELPYPQKTIIIDYRDTAHDCYPHPCALYFKRSVIDRTRMQRVATERPVLPIAYAVRPNFYEGRPDEVLDHERDIDVGCFFSPSKLEGHNKIRHRIARFLGSHCRLKSRYRVHMGRIGHNKIRHRVARFLAECHRLNSRYRVHTGIVGQPGRVGRNTLQANYFDMLKRCKIVVTCNPAVWEGDYRLYEALISGALVFVDRLLTPQPHPLLDRCHLVIFDARGDLKELEHKIEHYLEAPQERLCIARTGFEYVQLHHLWKHRAAYILQNWSERTVNERG